MVSKRTACGTATTTCYHPLFVFNQFGDLERCALRPGNVRSADGWQSVLTPVIERYKGKVSRICARLGDRRMKCGVPMQISPIRREAGRSRAGSSPRSNGIRANFIRASASS